MRWTIEPITSPAGSNPATSNPAAAGAVSNDVHAPPSAARRTRSAATGGRPRPSHSDTPPTLAPPDNGRSDARQDVSANTQRKVLRKV